MNCIEFLAREPTVCASHSYSEQYDNSSPKPVPLAARSAYCIIQLLCHINLIAQLVKLLAQMFYCSKKHVRFQRDQITPEVFTCTAKTGLAKGIYIRRIKAGLLGSGQYVGYVSLSFITFRSFFL